MQARNFDYDNSNTDGFFTAPGYNNEALSGTLATDVSAGLTAYFKCVWQGGGPQPKYPASMSLLVTTTVTTTGSVSYGKAGVTSGLKATANASDSLGDTLSASVMSPTDTSPSPLVTSYIVHASIDSGTGIASTGFSGQAQMTVSNMVPYTDYPYGRGTYTDYAVANATATITAQAVQDDRQVILQRNGARQVGKFAGSNGQTYGEWVDPDGTAHGDTTFSYWTFSNAGKSVVVADQINWQTFSPVFSGPWPVWSSTYQYPDGFQDAYLGDPNDPLYKDSNADTGSDITTANNRTENAPAVTWSWSPDESEDWELFGKWSAPDGNGENWSPNGAGDPGLTKAHSPVTKTISYAVKETVSNPGVYETNVSILDGASATANYDLTFHDPIDNWQWANLGSPATEEQPELYTMSEQVAVDPYHPVSVSVPVNNSALDVDIANYQGASLTMNTSAALVGAWPDVVGLSSPEGAAVAVLLTTAGYVFSSASPPAPSPDTASATFAAFQTSVTEQQKIESNSAGNLGDNNEVMRPDINRLPYGIVQKITSDNINQWFSGSFGAVSFQAVEGKHRFDRLWAGKGWDTAGYTGKVNADVHYPGTPFQIYEWAFGSTQPNH